MTLREAITAATARLGHPNARRDAELLLAHTIGRERLHLTAHPEESLSAAQQQEFEALVARRAAHEPLQYILGRQEFYGLDLRVSPAVLIPRPETEHLVEAVLVWAATLPADETLHIADIGTGSGAIAIALATHLAGARFIATDISAAALEVARENAAAHGCEDRIEFAQCDLLSGLESQFAAGFRLNAIASNPPYIPAPDAATLQPEVRDHEPHTALFAGEDGLEVYRRLIPAAQAALRPGGLLALEIGYGQRDAVAALLQGWNKVRFIEDYQGIPRTAVAERTTTALRSPL